MKIRLIFLSMILLLACNEGARPKIIEGLDVCEECGMIISNAKQGSVFLTSDGTARAFCNPVDMILYINKMKEKGIDPTGKKYLFDWITGLPVDANEAYLVKGDFQTAMGYGLSAFEKRDDAEKFSEEYTGKVIKYSELRERYETPDTTIILNLNSTVDSRTIKVTKGSLVNWEFINETDRDETVTVSGYDFSIEALSGELTSGTMIAHLPGDGFSVLGSSDKIYAKLIVTGDHTVEEAIYR